MTQELRDVLGGAEAATAGALPAYDEVVFARGVAKKARRRHAVRSAGTGALVGLALGVIGTGGFLVVDHFQGLDPALPNPTPSASDPVTPTPNPTAVGDVTVADGLPSATALTAGVLASADRGWVLAVFDSTFRSGTEDPIWGEKVLYLVSPTGDRYEVANLTRFGNPVLSAWDTDRQVAFLVDNRMAAFTVDLASGQVTEEWQFCGEGGSMRAAVAADGQWLLRGNCSGEALDGYYTDDGTLIRDDGVPDGEGVTVMSVGDVQVRFEFEMPPAESYVAYHADGTEVPLQAVGANTACYPMGPALDGGLAVQCWSDDGSSTLWSLDVDGGAAHVIADQAVFISVIDAMGGDGLWSLPGYCLTGDHETLTGEFGLAVLGDGAPTLLSNGEYRGTVCYGGIGDTVLVAGVGPLWTWDAGTGATVTLLPVPEPSDDGTWVGASENGAIIHP